MANLLLLGTALFITFLLGYILRCMFCKNRNSVGGFSGKRLWVFLLALIWALLSLWFYACKIKDMCDGSSTAATPASEMAAAAVISQNAITFNWSSSEPVTSDEFDAIKTRIVSELPDGRMLHIVGQHYNGEENASRYDDIGLARAVETARFFVGSVDESRILVSSESLGDFAGVSNTAFPAVKFEFADMHATQESAGNPATPLEFSWSSDEPRTSSDFDAVKAKLISNMGDDQALRIVGLYYASEKNSTSFENLGLARAEKVRSLFLPDADKNRVLIEGQLVKGNAGAVNTPFEAAKFLIIPLDDAGFRVKEAGDRRIVYFPFDSHQGHVDSNLENYLAGVAKELLSAGKSIRIVGHTDNQGNTAYNHRLGMQRAHMVGDLLVKHGISRRAVDMDSRGEDEPVADNNTDKGRSENRRVELFIQ